MVSAPLQYKVKSPSGLRTARKRKRNATNPRLVHLWFTALPSKQRFLEVSELHWVLANSQESRQTLLRKVDNATTLHLCSCSTGNCTQIALVWAGALLNCVVPTGSTSGRTCAFKSQEWFVLRELVLLLLLLLPSKGTTILLLQLWYSNSWNIWQCWSANKGYRRFLESFLHFPFGKVGFSACPWFLLSHFLRIHW